MSTDNPARNYDVLCVWPVSNKVDSIIVQARISRESCSEEEKVFMGLTSTGNGLNDAYWNARNENSYNIVHAALSLGFYFRSEADRTRWQTGESFEMYRNATRKPSATISSTPVSSTPFPLFYNPAPPSSVTVTSTPWTSFNAAAAPVMPTSWLSYNAPIAQQVLGRGQ
jgi:hypothetical protein